MNTQRWNIKYLARLWEKDIWHQLLWSSLSKHPERPKEWAAPSWFWASVDSAVEFKNPRLCCVEVMGCEIGNAGKKPFGQAQKGVLALKGVLKSLSSVRLPAPNLKTQRRASRSENYVTGV
jgi:hypothetical protein